MGRTLGIGQGDTVGGLRTLLQCSHLVYIRVSPSIGKSLPGLEAELRELGCHVICDPAGLFLTAFPAHTHAWLPCAMMTANEPDANLPPTDVRTPK